MSHSRYCPVVYHCRCHRHCHALFVPVPVPVLVSVPCRCYCRFPCQVAASLIVISDRRRCGLAGGWCCVLRSAVEAAIQDRGTVGYNLRVLHESVISCGGGCHLLDSCQRVCVHYRRCWRSCQNQSTCCSSMNLRRISWTVNAILGARPFVKFAATATGTPDPV